MKRITERDVVRLFDSRVDDPAEAERILAALRDDPQLAALAELLSEADDEADLPEPDRTRFPDLTRTRLGRLKQNADLGRLAEGTAVDAEVEYERGGRIEVFPLRLTSADHVVRLEEWPAGLRPVCFILAQFDLGRGRTPFHTTIKLPVGQPGGAADQAVMGAPLVQAAAATGDARSVDHDPDDVRSFWAEITGRRLKVRGALPEGRDEDVVIAEVQYSGRESADLRVRVPIRLERLKSQQVGEAKVEDFPLPENAVSPKATLSIRPLDEDDLALLPEHLVSALLAVEENFLAVPIVADGGGLQASLRRESQRIAVRDPQTTWWLRMSREGGEA